MSEERRREAPREHYVNPVTWRVYFSLIYIYVLIWKMF